MERNICYNCFREHAENSGPCPHCGYDPAADQVFIKAIKYKMPGNVQTRFFDLHINDREFADQLVKQILRMIENKQYQL